MKITRARLNQIIKEESESLSGFGQVPEGVDSEIFAVYEEEEDADLDEFAGAYTSSLGGKTDKDKGSKNISPVDALTEASRPLTMRVTRRQLRSIIRESVRGQVRALSEDRFDAAEQRRAAEGQRETDQLRTRQLQETVDWFERNFFESQLPIFPITISEKYLFDIPQDGGPTVWIDKGQKVLGHHPDTEVRVVSIIGAMPEHRTERTMSLREIYSTLENLVINNYERYNVSMTSDAEYGGTGSPMEDFADLFTNSQSTTPENSQSPAEGEGSSEDR